MNTQTLQGTEEVKIHDFQVRFYWNEYKSFCEKHGETIGVEASVFGLNIKTQCKYCFDENAEKKVFEKEKERERNLPNVWRSRGIREEYFSKTLEDYKTENESEENALEAVKMLKEGSIKKLLLLGDTGTGKTHLASALLKDFSGIYLTMYELKIRLQDATSKTSFYKELLSNQLIVLDEIGKSKGDECEENALAYIIDYVHTQNLRLILISNTYLPGTDFADENILREENLIVHYLSYSVLSRFQSNSAIVEIHGRDRRADNCIKTGINF